MFSVVELSVAICCASVPAIRVIFQSVATRKAKNTSSASASSNSGYSRRRHIREPSNSSTVELGLVQEHHHEDKDIEEAAKDETSIENIV